MAKNDNFSNASSQEFYKLVFVSLGLVVFQILLSLLSSTGFVNTLFMYLLGLFVSGSFDIDFSQPGWIANTTEPVPTWVQWTEALVDLILIMTGMFIWAILGIIKGVDAAFPSGDSPDDMLRKISGGNLFLKLVFAFISHITIMSFLRLWVNIIQGIKSLFTYGGGGGGGGGGEATPRPRRRRRTTT